jgi:hypothetical protein
MRKEMDFSEWQAFVLSGVRISKGFPQLLMIQDSPAYISLPPRDSDEEGPGVGNVYRGCSRRV